MAKELTNNPTMERLAKRLSQLNPEERIVWLNAAREFVYEAYMAQSNGKA
jgi:hypothetical protein